MAERDLVIPVAQTGPWKGFSLLWKEAYENQWGGSPDVNAALLIQPPSLNLQNVKYTEDPSTIFFFFFFDLFLLLVLFCFRQRTRIP